MSRKGTILAGGTRMRLHPLTRVMSEKDRSLPLFREIAPEETEGRLE